MVAVFLQNRQVAHIEPALRRPAQLQAPVSIHRPGFWPGDFDAGRQVHYCEIGNGWPDSCFSVCGQLGPFYPAFAAVGREIVSFQEGTDS